MIIDNIEHRMGAAEIRLGPGPIQVRDFARAPKLADKLGNSVARVSQSSSVIRTASHEGRMYGARIPRGDITKDSPVTLLRTYPPRDAEEPHEQP